MTHDLVTTSQAAEVLGVPASIISVWRSRGLITPVGLLPGRGSAGGTPLYHLAELEVMAANYRPRHADA